MANKGNTPTAASTEIMQIQLQEEACSWWSQIEARPADAALAQALESWLARSDRHRLAFAEVTGLAYALVQLDSEPLPAPGFRGPWRRLGYGLGGALLSLLLLALGWLWLPQTWQNLGADDYTRTGEIRTRTLADGSVLTLDSDSAVRVHISPQRRELELLRGALWVQVQPDPLRPFTVQSDGRSATALGTAYSVEYQSGRVVVSHGRVRVIDGVQQSELAAGEAAWPQPAGWLVRTAPEGAPDWTMGQRVFEQRPLREVLLELDRYLPQRLWLAQVQMLEAPVTAILDLADPQRALQQLCDAHGLRLRDWPGVSVISAQ